MKDHTSFAEFEIALRAQPELAAICQGAASPDALAEQLRGRGFVLAQEDVAALHAAASEMGEGELDRVSGGAQPGDPEHEWWVRVNSRRNLRNT